MEPAALRSGFACLIYIGCFLVIFHLLRRKMVRVLSMILLAGALALPALFPLYRFSLSFYLSEARQMGDLLLSDVHGLALGILLSIPVAALGFLLSREAWVGRWLWSGRRITPVTYRCLGQILGGMIFCYFAWFKPELAFVLACLCLCAFMLGEYSRLRPLPTYKPVLRGLADKWIGSAAVSEAEMKLYTPSLFFLLGIFSSLFLFPSFALYPLAMAALTDPLSGLVDEWLGRLRLPYSQHKTLEGSISFFFLGVAVLSPLGIGLRVSLLLSLGVTFLESLCVRGADNFVVPLSTGLFLSYFGR
jgi:dolichol kinase